MRHLRLFVPLLGACFNLGFGRGNRRQAILPALDLVGQTHPVGHRRLIRRFRQRQQFLYFGLQVGFDLLGVPIRQGAVPAGVGVNLGAVQTDGAETRELVLAGDLEDLDEGRLEFLAKASPKRRQGVVIRMPVAGNVPEGQRVVGRPLDLATGERPGGVAVDQQRQQRRRVIGLTAAADIGTFQCRQVESFHDIHDVARQVRLRQPVLYRRRQQVVSVSIDRVKGHGNVRLIQWV